MCVDAVLSFNQSAQYRQTLDLELDHQGGGDRQQDRDRLRGRDGRVLHFIRQNQVASVTLPCIGRYEAVVTVRQRIPIPFLLPLRLRSPSYGTDDQGDLALGVEF